MGAGRDFSSEGQGIFLGVILHLLKTGLSGLTGGGRLQAVFVLVYGFTFSFLKTPPHHNHQVCSFCWVKGGGRGHKPGALADRLLL